MTLVITPKLASFDVQQMLFGTEETRSRELVPAHIAELRTGSPDIMVRMPESFHPLCPSQGLTGRSKSERELRA
jgi:hypothetical protein